MAKQRADTHLTEDASEAIVRRRLPPEWVIRRFHPDYGLDLTIEVFERLSSKIPTMGEFLFVQLKSTRALKQQTIRLRSRANVEKIRDDETGPVEYELDVVKYVVDVGTIDNARLMGPSTPLMLFVVDVRKEEIYYVCMTDYYDKILEPGGFDFAKQNSITIYIPLSNRLSVPTAVEAMRFFAARAKLYGMFNLAQFQYREARRLLAELTEPVNHGSLTMNLGIVERFARRLRAMPIWDRPTIWALLRDYRQRLDQIIGEIDGGLIETVNVGVGRFLSGDDDGLNPLSAYVNLCSMSWEQFSAIGQTFEDIVREWFLPTPLGQLGSGENDTFREIEKSPRPPKSGGRRKKREGS
jgi:hypothetical protein